MSPIDRAGQAIIDQMRYKALLLEVEQYKLRIKNLEDELKAAKFCDCGLELSRGRCCICDNDE